MNLTIKCGPKYVYGYFELPLICEAYPVNLFPLTCYKFSSPVSITPILQIQLIFFSEGQLMYLENKSCTTEKKSCTRENKSCTWSTIILLNGA